MALKGNKGEWSEVYALFKLLGDKQMFAGDKNQNKIKSIFYPIIKMLRSEQKKHCEYEINGDIIIVSEDGKEIIKKPVTTFATEAIKLLTQIKTSSETTFSFPETEEFMQSISCRSLKAKSANKADIHIVLHDLRTGMCPLLGFSIKSQLGRKSTLLNSSNATNFTYRIESVTLTDAEISQINNINTKSKIQDRIHSIKQSGGNFSLQHIDNSIFKNNLILIDSCLPRIIAETLLLSSVSSQKTIKGLTEIISIENPLKYDTQNHHNFYEYKMKRFLMDIALGMMPATIWSGKYEANGGYLIIKEDGEVLCYHIYDKNIFEEYLYTNTSFETPSSTKFGFGKIIKADDGTLLFKLNLQIRFNK